MKNLKKRILLSITGNKEIQWRNKLKEIKKLKLTEVALFLEYYELKQRKLIYPELLKSNIKKIPLVHIRNDMDRNELLFLQKNFSSKYFTCHENGFKFLNKWRGFEKNIYLEMNYDNEINQDVDVRQIGGFCVDLSHFMCALAKKSKEYDYTKKFKNNKNKFACNHLNGYSFLRNRDVHYIKNKKSLNYLNALPDFIFSDVIAIETYNSIKKQLEYKKHIIKLLGN